MPASLLAYGRAELERLAAENSDRQHGAVFSLMLGSGLVLGEAIGLEWADVDEACPF